MFSRQRDPGLWTYDSVITGAELEYWDASVANAIDGQNAGAYSLAHDMTIGGAPGAEWTFELPLTVSDLFTATADVYIGASSIYTLTVSSTAFFQAPAEFHGSLFDVYGHANFHDIVEVQGTLFANGPIAANSEVYFFHDVFFTGGTTTFDGPIVINDNVNVALGAFFNFDGAYFDGEVTFGKPIGFTGTGAIKHRHAIGANANTAYSPLAYKDVIVIDGSLTGPVVYTIDDAGCVDTNEITFSNKDQSNTMQVKRPDGSSLGANSGHWYRCKRIAGTWQIVEEGTVRA